MATSDDSKARNQAFLQQLDRQRLQKPCQRVIDLRGKVPGECQAYEFGGRVHYLDDRAYLLARQLLQRTQGQYTIGVYEALVKALKLISADDSAIELSTSQPILLREPGQPQILRLDQPLRRREPRIRHTTSLLLRIADVEYHAATIDLTTSSLRISMRRAFSLQQADRIAVSFTSLQNEAADGLLTNVPYVVSRIEHDAEHSYLILTRQREANQEFSLWWDDWISRIQQPAAVDLDNELLNLARDFYLRLYCRMLPSPLLWLAADNSAETAVSVLHLGKTEAGLSQCVQSQLQLPLQALLADGKDRLLLTGPSTDSCRVDDSAGIQRLLTAQQQNAALRLLWLQVHAVQIDLTQHQQELHQLAALGQQHVNELQTQLTAISHLLRLVDISSVTAGLQAPTVRQPVPDVLPLQSLTLPLPTEFRHDIRRQQQRYVVHTPVVLHFNDQHYALTTQDISNEGLLLDADKALQIPQQSRVSIDFTRWQQQSRKLSLSGIPYVVKSLQHWQGRSYLGLQRLTEQCPRNINDFFVSNLAYNHSMLALRQDDLLTSQQSRIFSAQLSQQLRPVLLFFGMSSDNQRILQAVADTEHNRARVFNSLWPILAGKVGALSRELKPQLSDHTEQRQFGIYAYRLNAEADWQIRLEQEFETAAEKQRFLQRALSAPRQVFYQCRLMPFKLPGLEAETDLHQQLLHLRRYSSHKVKTIRETCNSLFALAELHDVSDILRRAVVATPSAQG